MFGRASTPPDQAIKDALTRLEADAKKIPEFSHPGLVSEDLRSLNAAKMEIYELRRVLANEKSRRGTMSVAFHKKVTPETEMLIDGFMSSTRWDVQFSGVNILSTAVEYEPTYLPQALKHLDRMQNTFDPALLNQLRDSFRKNAGKRVRTTTP